MNDKNFVKGYPFKINLKYPINIDRIELKTLSNEKEKIDELELLKKTFLENKKKFENFSTEPDYSDWYNRFNSEILVKLSIPKIFKYLDLDKIGKYIYYNFIDKELPINEKEVEILINKHILQKFPTDLYWFDDFPYEFNINDFKKYIKKEIKKDNYPIPNLSKPDFNKISKIYSDKTDKLVIDKKYTVLGIGGCGSSIVDYLAEKYEDYFNCLAIDGNINNLDAKSSTYKLKLNNSGIGCGGNFNCGYNLVTNQITDEIYRFTQHNNLIYIIASISKGIGSGSTIAVLKKLIKTKKHLVLFVILPFDWEISNLKRINIKRTVNELKKFQNLGLIVLNNSEFSKRYNNLSLKECIEKENELIKKMIVDNKFMNNIKLNINLLNKI